MKDDQRGVEMMKHSVFTVLLPEKDLDQVFELLKELGYDGVELRVNDDYHVSAGGILLSVKRIRELMTRHGLEIPVLATYLSIRDSKALLPVYEAAELLGSGGIRVSLGPALDGRRAYWSALEETRKDLEAFLKAVGSFKAKTLFEVHFKTLISSPSLAYLLLQPFDPAKVGIIYDPGNMIIEGREDWTVGVEVLKGYLGHVHVKNVSWQKQGTAWNWVLDELEHGMVDWPGVFDALRKVNYAGYISNEDLHGVPLPGATGFIGEKIGSTESTPQKPIETKLAEDLQYLKKLDID
jgi:sugar phosphate isomerase/epimerase